MSFASDVKRFSVTVTARAKGVVAGMTTAVHESITVGSPVTGAPGQPVDTGFLRNSWQADVSADGWSGTVGTNVAYAPVIETGVREAFDPNGVTNRFGVLGGRIGPALPRGAGVPRRKSTVGGKHSVKLTVANADALQRMVVAEVTR